MSYYDKIAQPGERACFFGHVHWIVYALPIILLVVAAALFIASSADIPGAAISFCLVGGILAIFLAIPSALSAWIRRFTTEMVVTDRRVIYKVGLIRRHTIEMNVTKIETVDVNQGIVGRMLGFGTIIVRGTGSTFEPLRKVANPLAFRNAILVG